MDLYIHKDLGATEFFIQFYDTWGMVSTLADTDVYIYRVCIGESRESAKAAVAAWKEKNNYRLQSQPRT
jgi:hypothetical protein